MCFTCCTYACPASQELRRGLWVSGNWSSRWSWAAVWVPGIEPGVFCIYSLSLSHLSSPLFCFLREDLMYSRLPSTLYVMHDGFKLPILLPSPQSSGMAGVSLHAQVTWWWWLNLGFRACRVRTPSSRLHPSPQLDWSPCLRFLRGEWKSVEKEKQPLKKL